jgi:HPr Serine kinase C-terminal domain
MSQTTSVAAPVFDPFGYSMELPLATEVNAHGFLMRVVTNSPDVIQTAEETWSGFPLLFTDHSLEFRVVVSDNEEAKRPSDMYTRAQGHLLITKTDEEDFAVGDLDRGFAAFWISPASARDHQFLCNYYLNNVMYIMLWHTHLTMVHAACVTRNGHGVLLCGPSGAGKSCLSFACALRGWTFVTDDGVSLARRSTERLVVGTPRGMHFRPTAVEVLPELEGHLMPIEPWGKLSFLPAANAFPEFKRAVHTNIDAVVFLNRDAGGPARLVPMSAEEAFSRLDRELPLMEQIEDQRLSLRRLVEARSFELRYSDLFDAAHALEYLAS